MPPPSPIRGLTGRPPHPAKAYLLLVLDIPRSPPVCEYARIYSEEVLFTTTRL